MSALIRNFEFEGAGVRVVELDDLPWFVLVDVCHVLEIGNSRQAASRLDDDEKLIHTMQAGAQARQLTVINESGLYSLILTSRKDEAKRFKKWVTGEVLPALRKHGHYSLTERDDEALPSLADTKVFGVRVAKVNAAAQLISLVNRIYGPEAARKLYESEPGLPVISGFSVNALADTAADDPIGCFKHLCRRPIDNNVTVGAKIKLSMNDLVSAKGLAACGIRIAPPEAPGCIAIADKNKFLSIAFAETQWQGEWATALRKLRSARPSRGVMQFGETQSRAVLLSKDEVFDLIPGV